MWFWAWKPFGIWIQARYQGWAYAALCFLGSHLGALAAALCHGPVTGTSFCLSPTGTELANWGFYLCKRQGGFQLFSAPLQEKEKQLLPPAAGGSRLAGTLHTSAGAAGRVSAPASLQTQRRGEERVLLFNSLKNGSVALSYPDIRAWGRDVLESTSAELQWQQEQ